MLRRRLRARNHEVPELNITAFLNLMVILIPFLLATAVFSRDAILEMNLAKSDGAAASTKKEWQLIVTVRKQAVEVADSIGGAIQKFDYDGKSIPTADINGLLQEIKASKPDQTKATLRLEADIPYDTIITVMDTIRLFESRDPDTNKVVQAELFPDVSLADAPRTGAK